MTGSKRKVRVRVKMKVQNSKIIIALIYIFINLFISLSSLAYAETNSPSSSRLFKWMTKKIVVTQTKKFPKYKLKLQFPVFVSDKIDQQQLDKANKTIKEIVLTNRSEFIEYTTNYRRDPTLPLEKQHIYYLENDYEVMVPTKSLASVRLNFENGGGGDHYLYPVEIINVQFNPFKIITIENLFDRNITKKALSALSSYARKKLKIIIPNSSYKGVYDRIHRGTGPTFENFEHVAISEKGLLIIFPPEDVACYGDGTLEVLVPWREIPFKVQIPLRLNQVK